MILVDDKGTEMCELDPESGLLSVSDWFRLYLAKSLDGKQSYLMRVPTEAYHNGEINLEAEVLIHLEACSKNIEAEYAKEKKNPEARVHYDWLVPKLAATFIADEDQGHRQINLLSIVDGQVEDFVPMAKLVEKYKVDVKTAAWILGRLYKLQSFLEMCGGLYNFEVDGVILEPRMHRMVYLGMPRSGELMCWDESLRNATAAINDWVEFNGTEHEEDFRKLLEWTCSKDNSRRMTGTEAHKEFYGKLDDWWGHKYHPFTYMERDTGIWHSITDAPKF